MEGSSFFLNIPGINGKIAKNTSDIKILDTKIKTIENTVSGSSYFDTVEDAITNTNFGIGERIYCRGYHKVNDGGGASYVTVEQDYEKPWLIETHSTWIDKSGKSCKVYLSIDEKTQVNYRQFGAYLDGTHDDDEALRNTHAYADSIFTFEANGLTKIYNCSVVNHDGIICKKKNEAINCCSNVDLSGSSIIMNNENAGWFGMYVWGDADSLFYDYELSDDVKKDMKKDCFYFPNIATGENALPGNVVLSIEEEPYCARDDAGYLYTVGRKELLLHDVDGIFSPPLSDNWNYAGGEEINCLVSDYNDNTKKKTERSYSKLKVSYCYYPSQQGHFIGCDVYMDMDASHYSSLFWCKRHNATIEGWNIRVNKTKMHNKAFKNAMIYLWDSVNVCVKDCHAFNNAGKMEEVNGVPENATSGYALRISNCTDVHVQDCRFQGYWGCTAMNSAKNIHFNRCHMNRLDTHDYCHNIYATDCFFYNHGIQIGYGRGLCKFSGCQWFYNPIPLDSYPSAHMVEFDLTYGRSFEGKVIVEGCRVWAVDPPDNEVNLFVLGFSPDATTITRHFELPEFVVRDLDVRCNKPDVTLTYFKVYGSRRACTVKADKNGNGGPDRIYGMCVDNTCTWQYYGRGIDYDAKVKVAEAALGCIIRCYDTFPDKNGKTQFYNERHYLVTAAGTLDYTQPAPTDTSGKEFKMGTATVKYIPDPQWKSKHLYSIGDICMVANSHFFPGYLFRCVKEGVSDGQYPTHTSKDEPVLEGKDSKNTITEPDECWWLFIDKTKNKVVSWESKMTVTKGQWILAVDRLYEVVGAGQLDEYPPYDGTWFGENACGSATLMYIGASWKPRRWYAKDSYCVAGENVYQCQKHSGITNGIVPTKGNPYVIDGDIAWKYERQALSSNEEG